MTLLERIEAFLPWHPLRRFVLQTIGAFSIVTVATSIRGLLNVPILPYLFFVPAIGAASFLLELPAGLVAVVLSALAAVYFFLPPKMGFIIQDATQAWSIVLFMTVTTGIAYVCAQLRKAMLDLGKLARTLEQRVEQEVSEKEKVHDALRQSQKMESIGQLTGGIAHDFNNLLAGISGSFELMRLNVAKQRFDKLPRYLDTAEHATKRAAELTHRLLAFSRKQTLEPRQTCVNELIEGMADMLGRTLGPEIVMRYDLVRKGLWYVCVDQAQLEGSLLNLCINSRDAMPNGGTISISVENLTLAIEQARERDLPVGDYVSISVTDNGSGIEPEIVARIFEPFFTTKRTGEGTGLGLAQVYGFARQSGGQVRVHSALGLGTTMRLLLPRHIPAYDRCEAVQPQQTIVHGTGHCILVVDDEAAIRSILCEALEEHGYRVIVAEGGQEAIDQLRSGTQIDLLLTDVGMPVSGRVVADCARDLDPRIPVLFVTGFANNLLPPEYLDSRKGVITKPFTITSILKRIGDMLSN